MKLTHSCIITENIKALTDFYEKVLEIKPEIYGEDYAEFPTDAGTLSLFSFKAHEELAPGSSKPGINGCLELEFQVEDVDQEFARLKPMDVKWVKHPTTQAWGNRSIYFRDPDGNLINFYTRTR